MLVHQIPQVKIFDFGFNTDEDLAGIETQVNEWIQGKTRELDSDSVGTVKLLPYQSKYGQNRMLITVDYYI